MDASVDVGTGSCSDGAVDLRLTSRDDVTSGRPLDLTLSGLTEAGEKCARCDAATPPDTPTSPAAAGSAFKKTMLKRYSKYTRLFVLRHFSKRTRKIANFDDVSIKHGKNDAVRRRNKILIKKLYECKGYNIRQFLREFPDKGWTKNSINGKVEKFGTVEQAA